MKICFNQNYAILAGSPWEETVVHAKVTVLEDQRLLAPAFRRSETLSFSLLFSPSLSLSHFHSPTFSLISPLILGEQRHWSLPAVPLLFKAFTVAMFDILIKHDSTRAHTQTQCQLLRGKLCGCVGVEPAV